MTVKCLRNIYCFTLPNVYLIIGLKACYNKYANQKSKNSVLFFH